MDYTAFRQNVQDMFARELGMTMVPGVFEGPNQWSTEKWIGSVAIAKTNEDPRNVAQVQIYLLCRFFAPFRSQGSISPNEPFDPSQLEDMARQVEEAVARNQTGLGAWYQRVTGIDYDHNDQGIQATVFAYSANEGLGFLN